MRLNNKILIIVLVVLVAIFGVVQLTKRGGKSKGIRTELVTVDTAQISKIELIGKERVTLTKSGSAWQVSNETGVDKPAKTTAIMSLIRNLENIKPSRMVAKSESSWAKYGVDSTATQLKLYDKDNELTADIMLGQFGVEGQNSFFSYVRMTSEREVYVADNFMSMSVGAQAADYRNNEIVRVNKDSLVNVHFQYPGTYFDLENKESWYLDDQLADSVAVVDFLNGLRSLNSRNFYNGGLADFTHKVVMSFTNQDDIVIEGALVNDGMIIRSSENSGELFLDDAAADKLFKEKDVFLATE